MEQHAQRESRQLYKVYTVVEKPDSKGIWLEIGVGSKNRDGSYRAKLDAYPVNGNIVMRKFEPQKKQGSGGSRGEPGYEPQPW